MLWLPGKFALSITAKASVTFSSPSQRYKMNAEKKKPHIVACEKGNFFSRCCRCVHGEVAYSGMDDGPRGTRNQQNFSNISLYNAIKILSSGFFSLSFFFLFHQNVSSHNLVIQKEISKYFRQFSCLHGEGRKSSPAANKKKMLFALFCPFFCLSTMERGSKPTKGFLWLPHKYLWLSTTLFCHKKVFFFWLLMKFWWNFLRKILLHVVGVTSSLLWGTLKRWKAFLTADLSFRLNGFVHFCPSPFQLHYSLRCRLANKEQAWNASNNKQKASTSAFP